MLDISNLIMKIDNITFQSKIKLISQPEFADKVTKLNPKRHYVGYPWQPYGKKTGKNLYTTGILDCICIGIIQGKKVSLMHVRTRKNSTVERKQQKKLDTKKERQKGFDIEQVKRRILDSINFECENIHAFIFGGIQLLKSSKYNIKELNKIKSIFDENQIPYSIIGAKKMNFIPRQYSLFYSTKEDTWFIANKYADKVAEYAEDDEIMFEGDKVSYSLYHANPTKQTQENCKQRFTTSIPEFFKNQFREVRLCEFDEFA